MSLWKVDDNATRDLMIDYYEALDDVSTAAYWIDVDGTAHRGAAGTARLSEMGRIGGTTATVAIPARATHDPTRIHVRTGRMPGYSGSCSAPVDSSAARDCSISISSTG